MTTKVKVLGYGHVKVKNSVDDPDDGWVWLTVKGDSVADPLRTAKVELYLSPDEIKALRKALKKEAGLV